MLLKSLKKVSNESCRLHWEIRWKKISIDFAHDVHVGLEYSESSILYSETGRNVEKWITTMDIAFLKITPIAAVCPASIGSLFTYFMTDSGASAFVLPTPMW